MQFVSPASTYFSISAMVYLMHKVASGEELCIKTVSVNAK